MKENFYTWGGGTLDIGKIYPCHHNWIYTGFGGFSRSKFVPGLELFTPGLETGSSLCHHGPEPARARGSSFWLEPARLVPRPTPV